MEESTDTNICSVEHCIKPAVSQVPAPTDKGSVSLSQLYCLDHLKEKYEKEGAMYEA